MIVVGGLASLPGSVIGALVLTVTTQLSTGLGKFSIILTGAVMLAAVLFVPGGLATLWRPGGSPTRLWQLVRRVGAPGGR